MKYPITVNKINFENMGKLYKQGFKGGAVGKFVAIRPVADEFEGKTYLGLYLGEIAALGPTFRYNKESQELEVSHSGYNPAIYVFDLQQIIFGYESWWGIIKSEDQLKQITDADIENVWYVKALKQIDEMSKEEKSG
jgi:hypothetical protein